MAYLEVKNFNKSFDDTKVLKDVCFSMEKGEVLSVIGSSGSGKTTALRCLVGLETPDSGEAFVDGKRIIPRDKNTVGDEIGMVFQSFNLFPQYTVLKNVTLAMDVRSEKLLKKQKLGFSERNRLLKDAKAANREKALVLLEKVGLSDKAASYPWQLSGGQSQRVAIARALALQPSILCFDEPTSALDPLLTQEVLEVIRSLKSKDMTMLIVTHEMNFARSVSDKVAFMSDGIISCMGSPDYVFGDAAPDNVKSFIAGTRRDDAN